MNINQIVIEYKKTKSDVLLKHIYDYFEKILNDKAHYIFFKKRFPYSLYYRCKQCQICKEKNREICKVCKQCTCDKRTFTLKDTNACEYEDVLQDLKLALLRMIDNFDITKEFQKYFYATLWEWRPSFITRDLINNLDASELLTEVVENETKLTTEVNLNIYREDIKKILETFKSANEQEVIRNLLTDNKLTQQQLAQKLHISQQRISQIVGKIRNKLKKFL